MTYLLPNSILGNACGVCCICVYVVNASSNTRINLPVLNWNTLTFRSFDIVANRRPSGDTARPVTKALFFANSNKPKEGQFH